MGEPRQRKTGVEPRWVGEVAQRIVSGELAGERAFEALVERILADEVPPHASHHERMRVRDQVVLGISHDRELCEMLYRPAAAVAPRPRGGQASPPAPDRPTRVLPDRPKPQAKSPVRVKPAPAKPVEDFELASSTDRSRIYIALGVAAAIVAVVGGYVALRPDACDELAQQLCFDVDAACQAAAVRTSLREHEVKASSCQKASIDLELGLSKVGKGERGRAYGEVLVQTLGFDPRGVEAAAPDPEPKREPKVIVQGQPGITSIFIDVSHVYWTRAEPPGIHRTLILGGDIETLAEHPNPVGVFASRDFVYWLSRGQDVSTLWTDLKRGEHEPQALPLALEPLSTEAPAKPRRRRSDDDEPEAWPGPSMAQFLGPEVVFVDKATGRVAISLVSGEELRILAPPSPVHPQALAASETEVYWYVPAPVSSIFAAPRPGGASRVVATQIGALERLLVHGSDLFMLDRSGAIFRWSQGKGQPELVVSGMPGLFDFAVGPKRVYFTVPQAGRVAMVAHSGGPADILIEGEREPKLIAVDGAGVYWQSEDKIKRLPLPRVENE